MKAGKSEFHIVPMQMIIPLHLRIMNNSQFLAGEADTGFVERTPLGK
jgi:biotin carboxylase